MKLIRTAFYLTISMTISGFVQAESASLYTQVRKSLHHTHRSIVTDQVAKQASAAPEMQPIDTILPAGTRVVAGDENEFYILTQDQADPLTKVDIEAAKMQKVVMSEEQLKRIDAARALLSFNSKPHVDDILSQIAHKAFVPHSSNQQNTTITTATAKTQPVTIAANVFAPENKNGEVTDYHTENSDKSVRNEVKTTTSETKLTLNAVNAVSSTSHAIKLATENFSKDSDVITDYKVALDNVFAEVERSSANDEPAHAVAIQAKNNKPHHPTKPVSHLASNFAAKDMNHHAAPIAGHSTHIGAMKQNASLKAASHPSLGSAHPISHVSHPSHAISLAHHAAQKGDHPLAHASQGALPKMAQAAPHHAVTKAESIKSVKFASNAASHKAPSAHRLSSAKQVTTSHRVTGKGSSKIASKAVVNRKMVAVTKTVSITTKTQHHILAKANQHKLAVTAEDVIIHAKS